jgi:hypothetical protein
MNVSLATLSLTRNLQELAAQIAEAPGIHTALRTAMGQPDIGCLVKAKMDGHRHIQAMALTTQRLRIGVVGVDGLGSSLESLSELVLRAVRLVVISELTVLRDLRHGPHVLERQRLDVEARIGNVDAVADRLRDELDRITRLWCGYRGTPSPDRAAYRQALRAAHRAMRALVNDREISQFINAATSCTWPAFREASMRIWNALMVRIDAEPDMALLPLDALPRTPSAEHAS